VKRDRIFVGGLDYSLRENDLRHHFERYGEVRDVEIVRDPNSKASRGFGFVTFRDDRVAERLITEV
jgi:heterogeneous nuclear ribonucleoprotein A1/A3